MSNKKQSSENQPDAKTAEKKKEQNNSSATEKTKEDKSKKTQQKKQKEKQPKKQDEQPSKKKESKKEDQEDTDFQYIVRIANTDIDGDKPVTYALTSIKGIGRHLGILIADEAGVSRSEKIGKLSEDHIHKIQEVIDTIDERAPGWMLNHTKQYDTGSDTHLVGPDVSMTLREDINRLKKIRAYRGVRHERGLRVRGQRTRAHPRTGLSMGVSREVQRKKKEAMKKKEEE